MFEVRIVVALAFVCLQVCCVVVDPINNYLKLFDCIINNKGPFQHFIPFHIGNFPFVCSNFSGEYENVHVDFLDRNVMYAELISNSSNGTEVITFRHTFINPVLEGLLRQTTHSKIVYEGVVGLLKNLELEGEVSYGNQKVTQLKMTVTFESVSLLVGSGALLPFTNGQTEQYYRKYFKDNKEAIENKTIALINAKIDTPEKFASVKAACGIE